jgi:predicted tellurium resistance membrane protein TerC
MRIALLFGVAWLVSLTSPYITISEKSFSVRDLILIGGGVFLLFKATIELHERIEGDGNKKSQTNLYSSFYSIIAQIVILDAVFSIDSVITAIGMVDDTSIMITAVVIAVVVMIIASKPLTTFVNAHPALIVLCLGFLLMIGFSLVTEGFGFSIPKGYLYAAIGFSLIVEIFNQLIRINRCWLSSW